MWQRTKDIASGRKFTQHSGGPEFDSQYHQKENMTLVTDPEPFVTLFSQLEHSRNVYGFIKTYYG